MRLFGKPHLLKRKSGVYYQDKEIYLESKVFRLFVKGFFMLKRFVVQGGSSRVTDAGGTE